jgi:hypothetical protein
MDPSTRIFVKLNVDGAVSWEEDHGVVSAV